MPKNPAQKSSEQNKNQVFTLTVDIGGTGIKASVLDENGNMIVDRVRVTTPHPCPPDALLDAVAELVEPLPASSRVSARAGASRSRRSCCRPAATSP